MKKIAIIYNLYNKNQVKSVKDKAKLQSFSDLACFFIV